MVSNQKIRYLLVGSWNTIFGYSVGVALYGTLSPYLHILGIGVIANIFAISMSFLTYKLLVFKTVGHWLPEYLRSYVVYGGTALLGTLLLWLFVDGLKISIWIAQGLIIVSTVVISYIGHARFTFSQSFNKKLRS